MKRYFILILAILISGVAAFFYSRPSSKFWYGSFKIDDDTVISLIAVGHDAFYDANSDGVPQHEELIASDGKLNFTSQANGEEFLLKDISMLLVPEAVSPDLPQLMNAMIQSKQNANVWKLGTVTMSLDQENVETEESASFAIAEVSFDNCPAGTVPPSKFRVPIRH